MGTEVIIAVSGAIGSLIGALGGVSLTNYRLKQLEKKVEVHNNLISRMVAVEKTCDSLESDLGELKSDIKEIFRELRAFLKERGDSNVGKTQEVN